MKTENLRKSAFTLVEMLVVITIISLVAMAIVNAVKGAQRAANATKCQANLKNLHTAVVAYLADRRGTWGAQEDFEKLKNETERGTGYTYPRASSYECRWDAWENGEAVEKYYECHGWIAWVPLNGSRRDSNGKTPWIRDHFRNSHAEKFYYPANIDEKMRDAISEGFLFKYVGKDFATYQCPEHRKDGEGRPVYLAYSMNSWFGSHSDPSDSKKSAHPSGARTTKSFTGDVKPSGMALFIEMEDATEVSSNGRTGLSAKKDGDRKAFALEGDSAWEWGDLGKEKGRFSHRRGGTLYCNVIFVDGHAGSIPKDIEDSSEWNGHDGLDEVFKNMGKGTY